MKKLLRYLVCLVTVVGLFLLPFTGSVSAVSYHDLAGTYELRMKYTLQGLDITRGDRYTTANLYISDETSGVLTGTLELYDLVQLATGKLTNATGRYTSAPIYLDRGANSVTCTRAGTCVITLPTGVTGTAASGTATVTGSPVTLTAATATTVTTTTIGTVTVTLVGAKLTDGTGTFTGSPISLDGSDTVACTVAGNCVIALPAGVTGTATSGTMTVTNSPVALVPGNNTVTTSGAIGNFTVALVTTTVLTGYVGDGTGSTRFMLWSADDSGVDVVLEGKVRVDGSTIVNVAGNITGCFAPLSAERCLIKTRFSGPWEALQ